MRWLSIVASLALACAPSLGAAAPARAPQTSSSSTPSKQSKHKGKHHSKREPSQKAPTADRVSEIQSALARGGYYQGQPNGKWDSNTVAALQKFQSAKGIEANGKLDAPTLQKLGPRLGYRRSLGAQASSSAELLLDGASRPAIVPDIDAPSRFRHYLC